MVRRMNPSLGCRVDTSHPATAASSSISLATAAPGPGARPPDASSGSLPSLICACCPVFTAAFRRIACR